MSQTLIVAVGVVLIQSIILPKINVSWLMYVVPTGILGYGLYNIVKGVHQNPWGVGVVYILFSIITLIMGLTSMKPDKKKKRKGKTQTD
ncbi:MAG: hypothetical protein LBT80_01805 [Lactobacillaceae bacterium]|jgi:hypothetical protein|nr:hypothetical protein [Lactobacillaceae bacterium]